MTDEIPQWALERATELVNKEKGDAYFTATYVAISYTGQALARYIAQHEEKPIDPLLIEAREIVAEYFATDGSPITAAKYSSGAWDSLPAVLVTVEALRRGIELGKAGAA